VNRRALGKGLGALLGDGAAEAVRPQREVAADQPARLGDREAIMVPVMGLAANPNQPRRAFNEQGLEELAASIRQNGVLQPILVRRVDAGLEIVAGERRVRAARMAELSEIPALVCSLAESESMRVALLENIQREDLDAIEEAEAYKAIMDHYGASHGELAVMLGKSRPNVSNMLRLLRLEVSIRELVQTGALTMGHARALLGVEDTALRLQLARDVERDGWSVRQLERKVLTLTTKGEGKPKSRRRTQKDPEAPALREYEDRMFESLGSPCTISRRGKKGSIKIEFFSNEELERVLEAMGISSQL
jgi:ParB family chromosome partitioning protein